MGIQANVKFKIIGQVDDDIGDNDYRVLRAELELICTRYNLTLEEDIV